MFKLIQNLLTLNGALFGRIRALKAYDEAMALQGAKEYTKAFLLLKEAAELGHVEAMALLGTAYLLGQGCRENGAEAERWLLQAVAGGYTEAESTLAMAYATGKAGCRQDLDRAIPMLESAAAAGDVQSARMLEMIERGEGIFARHKRQRKGAAKR